MSLEEFFKIINVYSLPNFFVGLVFFAIGLFVWLKNKTEKKNISFLFLSVVASLWLVGFSLGYSARDPAEAMMLFKISYSFVMLIAISVTHFVALFLNQEKKIRGLIIFGYVFFGLMAAVNISTPLIVKGIYKYFWGYYPNLNTPFNALFLAVFMAYVVFAIFLALSPLLKKQKDLSEIESKRIKFVLVGLIIYSVACFDFFAGYGIEIYPFGYIPTLIFVVFTSYAVFRYGAFETEKILRQKEIFEAFKRGENKYIELIENTPLCIKVFDGKGNLLFLNKGGRDEHFLKDTDDISKWNWLGTVKEEYRAKAKELFERALKGEASAVEFEHTPEGSKHEWCSGIISPIKDKDGNIKSILFYSADITALKKAELQAKQNEQMFKTLLDATPLCIKWFDNKGNLISINKGGREEHHLENLSDEQIKNWEYMECIDEAFHSEVKSKMAMALKGESSTFEIKHVPGTSKGEWCLSTLTPVKNSKGEVEYVLFLSKDITDEKLVEEEHSKNFKKSEETKMALFSILEDVKESERNFKDERDRSTAIIQSMGEGLFVINKDYKTILMNPVAEKLFGISASEVVGRDLREICAVLKGEEELSPDQRPLAKTLATGQSSSFDLEDNLYLKVRSTGKTFPMALVTSSLKGDGIIGAVVIFRDITAEKALDEAKSNFISISSHQLRTPLTSMRWFAEMLMGGDAGPITEEQKHFVERIYQATERMINLVNLLLQLARVEAGRLKVEPTLLNLKNLTQSVAISLKADLDKKSQKVEIVVNPDPFPEIPLDQEIIWQVIQNLISNASRYSPEGKNIQVLIVNKDGLVECSVKDQGIGIPKSQKDKIFERFFRADNALKMVPEGSGLGLSLVKLLVEEWGGKIWFDSEENKGTTFFFTIPVEGMKKKEGEVKLAV